MSSAVEQSPTARSIGCKACLDPFRWSRHRARLGCNVIEVRRDQVTDHYVRLLESEREIAKALGLSPSMVHLDLVARRVAMRPQARGLNRGLSSPEHLQALQDGHHRYRADVEREKAERELLDVDELVTRMRRAGVPRSKPAIVHYVRDGLIEPECGLGFEKPWLFTEASADALVRRLLSKYQDGRLTRFNPTTQATARFRASWYKARHNSSAEFGRLASQLTDGPVGRPLNKITRKDKSVVKPEKIAEMVQLWADPEWSQQRIANRFRLSRDQVKRVLARSSSLTLGENPSTG